MFLFNSFFKFSLLPIILPFLLVSCKGASSSNDSTSSTKESTLGQITSDFDYKAILIFQDKQENYWFGGNEKGLYKYDGEKLMRFTKEDGLCSHAIIGIQEDHLGNVYFDTPEGVSKFDGHRFTTLTVIENDSSKHQWKLTSTDLWFRMGWSKKGPYRYDGKHLYYLEFPPPKLAETFYAKHPTPSYSPYGIYSMYKDRNGHLWFGTSSLGLCRFDGSTLQWLYEEHLSLTSEGGEFGIRAIIEDQEGYFWFSNNRYRYKISPTTSNRTTLDYQRENEILPNDKATIYYMSIVEDNNGALWMATYDEGVWCKQHDQLTHYPIKRSEKTPLIFSIYQDKQGKLWLTTHDSGIYCYNGKQFEPFHF